MKITVAQIFTANTPITPIEYWNIVSMKENYSFEATPAQIVKKNKMLLNYFSSCNRQKNHATKIVNSFENIDEK